jgi:hypothetical protein
VVRLAFISDIHGNGVALDAVLGDIAVREIDEIVVPQSTWAGDLHDRIRRWNARAAG